MQETNSRITSDKHCPLRYKKKKDVTGHFRYTRDTMIRYVEGKVKEMIMKNEKPEMNDLIIKPEMNDLIIDCAIVSHGQGVMNIK